MILSIVSFRAFFLEKFAKKVFVAFSSDYKNMKVVPLPKNSKLFTVLKSPHVNKKFREQFCLEKHQKLIFLGGGPKPSNIKCFLEVISCKGVAFKVVYKGG
jgi:ribosomal protein S10